MEKSIEEYERYLYRQELAESTIQTYVRIGREFLKFIGQNTLTKEQTMAYKRQISSGKLSVGTVNLRITALNRYLEFCGAHDCRLRTQRCQKRMSVDNVISDDDYRRLLAYTQTHNYKYYCIMKTLAMTGIRVSELQYITVENVRDGRILINNKGKVREIMIPDGVIRIICEYCSEYNVSAGSVFQGNTGKPISRVAVWKEINQLADKIGIDPKKAHPHSFRHYFALLYMKHYANLFELADLLGHSSLETTRIYANATVEDKRRRMDALDENP